MTFLNISEIGPACQKVGIISISTPIRIKKSLNYFNKKIVQAYQENNSPILQTDVCIDSRQNSGGNSASVENKKKSELDMMNNTTRTLNKGMFPGPQKADNNSQNEKKSSKPASRKEYVERFPFDNTF